MNASHRLSERFQKQALVPGVGEVGMQRISESTAVMLGLGGGGCVGAHQFALSNVGHLVLCDHDIVEYSNLGRQYLFTEQGIGKHKVEAASAALKQLNPGVSIETIPSKVSGSVLSDVIARYRAPVFYVAIDKWERHFFINRFCIENGVRAVHMGSLGFKGFVYAFDPAASRVCFECAMRQGYMGDTNVGPIDEGDTVYSYLPPVISAVASMAVVEGVKMMLGGTDKPFLNAFLMYRASNHADILEPTPIGRPLISLIDVVPNPDCPKCAKCAR